MDNSFFLCSEKPVEIEKFQICTWEFDNHNSLIEFGIEIKSNNLNNLNNLTMDLYIPWLEKGVNVEDFYNKLKDSDNSRFIFNDSVNSVTSLDNGQNEQGVIHKFHDKQALCILPVELKSDYNNKKVQLIIDLQSYNNKRNNINVYIRIAIKPKIGGIPIIKIGTTKSTILYDIKLNESRNITNELMKKLHSTKICMIDNCFCFHIIPNRYSINFLESEHLKTIRTLEFVSFKKYLGDSRLKKDELMVIFSKKKNKDKNSYSFFSIYTDERIGKNQVAFAILVNIICAFLFALPTVRDRGATLKTDFFQNIPIEFYIASILIIALTSYFFLPFISKIYKKYINFFLNIGK